MNPDLGWLTDPLAQPDATAGQHAAKRQALLTKPPGALGRLESLVIRLAGLQGNPLPSAERARIVVFAADHGVAVEGVSAFPQSVTAAMVRNFAAGGAAVSVLARELGAELDVVNLGTVEPLEEIAGVTNCRLGPGTANFTLGPAMTEAQLAAALNAGRDAAERAYRAGVQVFIGGEMGIANTTAATALAAALLKEPPDTLAGPGTGLSATGQLHKIAVIERALVLHTTDAPSPLEILRRLGGFEIAALTGAYLRAAQWGLPVLVDGFIATAAALVAERLQTGAGDCLMYAHASAEPGHKRLLAALDAQPLLALGMRLGEGSGAAVALPLLRLACALHRNMATFAEAGVAEKRP